MNRIKSTAEKREKSNNFEHNIIKIKVNIIDLKYLNIEYSLNNPKT